jgi:glyoxylase-like metal-dependent hydrolase (beta-lactamase superfamily II)
MEVLPNVHVVRLIGAQAYLLVDGDEITLVDAGHAGSARLLRPYLARIGRSLEHITRIVCTHGHPDHIGGVHEIGALSGADVLLHPADAERLVRSSRSSRRRRRTLSPSTRATSCRFSGVSASSTRPAIRREASAFTRPATDL